MLEVSAYTGCTTTQTDIFSDRATLIMDEFYGGYNYTSDCDGTTVSAADNIIDVNEDDVILIDGLTKRFRLPGWVIKIANPFQKL